MVDLHLHLDGSLRPQTVWELAEDRKIALPAENLGELKKLLTAPENCKSLNEYLERFDLPLLVLQDEAALERAAYELVEDLALQGLEYAEIRFAPQLSAKEGLSQDKVTASVIEGMNRALHKYSTIRTALILCCMRDDKNKRENMETIETAGRYLGKGVAAVDLAGAEGLFKTSCFQELFERAKELNIPFTIHAGEADGPESVWKALEYGAKRIGHGVRAIEDEALMEKLAEEKITLEMCVTSNIQTKTVKDRKSHPIRKFFDRGIHVTVNTDNMTVSDTTLEKEYRLLKEEYGFTEEELEKMNRYALEAAFLKE